MPRARTPRAAAPTGAGIADVGRAVDLARDGAHLVGKRHLVRIERPEPRGAARDQVEHRTAERRGTRRTVGPVRARAPPPRPDPRSRRAPPRSRRRCRQVKWFIATTTGRPNLRTFSTCRARLTTPRPHRGHVLAAEIGACHAAVHLQRPDRRDDHRRGRREPGGAALDVEELLAAEIGAEPGLGHHACRRAAAPSRVAITELQPCAMLANGPPWTSAGVPSSVCTRLGCKRVAQQHRHGAAGLEVGGASPRGRRAAPRPSIRPSRACRSARSRARQKTAITSEAAVMSKPSSRG